MEWIQKVDDHEGNERERAGVRRNVQNTAEDIQQQAAAPDHGKETSNLYYTQHQNSVISVLKMNPILISVNSVVEM